MPTSKIRKRFGFSGLLLSLALAPAAHAQTSGSNGAHDPSRMIESNGKVFIYSTGGGGKSSPDGLVWTDIASPPWNKSLVANNQGIWAPDGLYLNGQYLLFGSMWSADKSSALVLLTTPSLDPASPDYKYADKGVVVAGPVGVTHSVIDPAPVLDAQGNLWVSWGGGYPFATTANSIFVTRLDNNTGLPVTTDPGWKPPDSPGYAIAQGHKEGSYVYYHGGNYFLWYQTGSCCSGTASTYTMHVARATAITGPYSGDRTFYAGGSGIHGPGHIGIYSCGGVERFTYHYYPDNGSIIGENALTWGSDGWPVAGPQVSTGLKLPCATMTTPPAGGSGGATSAGGATSSGGAATAGGTGVDTGGTGDTDAGTPVDTGGSVAASGGALETGGAANVAGSPGSAGASVVAAGGAAATAGSGPTGEAAAPSSTSSSDAGCSCEVSGKHGSNRWGGLLLLGAVAALKARKRRAKAL